MEGKTPSVERGRRSAIEAALLAAAVFGATPPARACDVCAIYTATELRERRTGWRIGIGEQFTHFATLRENGHEVPNPGERLDSAITQVQVGYNFTPRLGLQVNVPIVSRTFRRLEHGRLARGDETGVGDLSLLASVLALSETTEESVFRLSLLGGLELPSGDTERLGEEQAEHGGMGDGGTGHDHAEMGGVHGHDLALGSGSVDGLVGGQLFWSWRRLFVTGLAQYALRTEGDFAYAYATELVWSTGTGGFLVLTHDHSLGAQALLSGDTKAKDRSAGAPVGDTGLTSLYLGPGATFTWGSSLGGDLAVELPVVQHETGRQIVPEVRVRGGVTWRF